MRLLTAFHSAESTGASCAFHIVCFDDGVSGRITRCLPLEKRIWSDSADQQSVYTAPSAWARLARNMPLRLQDLTCPSSPLVASDEPSFDQRSVVTAPECAPVTTFSMRPALETSLKEPSVQPTTKTSEPLPPCSDGNHRSSVQNVSTSISSACGSPSTSHIHTFLSSATVTSSFAPDQEVPVTMSVCFFVGSCETSSRIARGGRAAAAAAAVSATALRGSQRRWQPAQDEAE